MKEPTLIDLIPFDSPYRKEAEETFEKLVILCKKQVNLPFGDERTNLNEPIIKLVCRIKEIESKYL